MLLISFDCANKSLAVAVVEWNIHWADSYLDQLRALGPIKDEQDISKLDLILTKLLDDYYNQWHILYMDVVDLISGKKVIETSVTERCLALKTYVTSLDRMFPVPDIVLIEDQMTPNEKSRGVFYCLMYHYTPMAKNVNARHKNDFNLGGGYITDFLLAYSKSEAANKAHTKANMLAYLERTNQMKALYSVKARQLLRKSMINPLEVAICSPATTLPSKLDDLADALIQCFWVTAIFNRATQNDV